MTWWKSLSLLPMDSIRDKADRPMIATNRCLLASGAAARGTGIIFIYPFMTRRAIWNS
jgi:hypothetical protein